MRVRVLRAIYVQHSYTIIQRDSLLLLLTLRQVEKVVGLEKYLPATPFFQSEIVVVDRGPKTLMDLSTERGDEYLKDEISVTVHKQCRKAYTRKSNIAAPKKQREAEIAITAGISPPRTRARGNESSLCFKKFCLFCGNEAVKTAEMK
ncbi:hypothetical protein ACJJTC_015006 [Scirpophaga incertulas]